MLDCQATHSDPTKGAVFEIGWAKTNASESLKTDLYEKRTESFLIKLPDSIKISNPIKKITGIQTEDLQSAFPQKTIWSKLLFTSQETAAQNDMPACPAIIHYAGYETPFLKYFHKQYNPEIPFPFHIICTHQIIKRLLPGLPRKGLRAEVKWGPALHRKSQVFEAQSQQLFSPEWKTQRAHFGHAESGKISDIFSDKNSTRSRAQGIGRNKSV